MPYIYWQPRPQGGYAYGTITRIVRDHDTHDGWCFYIQPEDNPQLSIHVEEPMATWIIYAISRNNIGPARVEFLYGTQETEFEVFAVWLLE